jgi:glucose/arabinose dehydrogenase
VNLRSGALTRVDGVPPVHGALDGGLLDVALHPDFARNRWVYLAYSTHTHDGTATAVDRAHLVGHRLVDGRRLFTAKPSVDNSEHFGGRIVVSGGYLFVSVGERNQRQRAQDLKDDNGKIIRLKDDGSLPADNPFASRDSALPEIWSYGHRNPQGLAINPADGSLWEHEHGPKGGDEVNIIRPGLNYGWPVITYGREYSGEPVGEGITRKEGMEQPVYYYVPSIAPSGMTFYTGAAFPGWRGDLFIGAMALRHLNRLVIRDGKVVREERILGDRGWRVRVVKEGPDGSLYIGVDAGLLLRLGPA